MSRMPNLVVSVLVGFTVLQLNDVALAQSQRSPRAQPRQERPAAQINHVPRLSPELEQILLDWSNATKGITKLQGKHRRFVYDTVWEVEKRATGFFYYEAPDKGRIDISPVIIGKQEVSRRKGERSKKRFKLEPEQPQHWICNGRDIRRINPVDKTYEVGRIPKKMRGTNIINGPLPFLFGMPPEQAKLRYTFDLLGVKNGEVWLRVIPRKQFDAAEWREAKVILVKKKQYLPRAVQLIDPSGNLETVYSFVDMKINPRDPFLPWQDKDPFNPTKLLRGYKLVAKPPQGNARPQNGRAGANGVPNVVNFPVKNARQLIEHAGFEVRWKRGKQPPRPELLRVVYAQDPIPETMLPKGRTVTLWWYAEPLPRDTAGNR